ncbi:hypothetical protein CCP3SC1AL1_350002 [Gammaproteobacteria bacterium]
MTNFRKNNGALTPMGSGKKRVKVLDAIYADEAVSKAQLDLVVTTTIESNNNIWTGTNSFSNAAGVTSDIITPRTSGAGTSLQAPVINWTLNSSPAVTQSGSVIYANAATTTVTNTVTLPACATASIGTTFKIKVVKAVTAGGTYVINTTGTDVFLGGIYGTIANNSTAGDSLFAASTVNKTITLSATTTGGLIGGWIELTMISATQWSVSGMTLGTGAIATPFSN